MLKQRGHRVGTFGEMLLPGKRVPSGGLSDIRPGTCETSLIKLLTIDYRSCAVSAPEFKTAAVWWKNSPSHLLTLFGSDLLDRYALSWAFEIIFMEWKCSPFFLFPLRAKKDKSKQSTISCKLSFPSHILPVCIHSIKRSSLIRITVEGAIFLRCVCSHHHVFWIQRTDWWPFGSSALWSMGCSLN